MWSVVTESPTETSTRAPTMSGMVAGGVPEKFWKNGGSCTYVELGSQSYERPVGDGIVFQKRSPSKILAYSVAYISCVIALPTTAFTSSGVGQRSFRNTGWPCLSFPIGWSCRSIWTVPASANATTSGGEARKLDF